MFGKRITRTFFLCMMVMIAALGCLRYYVGQPAPQNPQEIHLSDAEKREAWLNLYGWEVTLISETVTQLPSCYRTQAGMAWESIQRSQGLSPTSFAGMQAKRYLYHIDNLCADTYYAELLLCGDVLVGAVGFDAVTGEQCRLK